MGETMQAAVLYGRRDVRIESLPVPSPGSGEILVRVEAALTDGTDLKVFRRGYHARMITPPARFGHEFAGSIASVGPGAGPWTAGDRVVAANSAPCGACYYCSRQQESLCEELVFVNGAYAGYLVLPARIVSANLLRIPSDVPGSRAAFTEPLACVVKGVRDLAPCPGETIAVVGSGPIGLMAARLLVLSGARVLLVGRRQLDLGEAMGAEVAHAPEAPEDLPPMLKDLSGGIGPDRVFEATGLPEIWEASIDAVRRGGAVNLFGGCPAGTRVSFDTNRVHYGEVSITSSFHHTPRDVREALRLIREQSIDVSLLVDGEAPLAQLPKVLSEMDARSRTLKTVIRPS